ncbi:hypothetical protein DEJ17_10980 [Curtobacterium sp. MCSS17_011]|uniref:hypothetical protein n=1 Tax=Curtobacterium sp. MCSS17_011 TaxID=2175643 RepID=UPI000DA06B9E|nr:hypothetical protein [Curtobacterium sp. MCSS17_011]PYY56525.1 hypothetical protein DEJ17_10980 [Curtobacterium sp. MCSS17_011]
MAIKKRTPQTDAEPEAAIAAFGAGATPPEDEAPAAPVPAAPPRATSSGDVPSTSLVRWADEDLPCAIQRIAAAEDRSFQKTMLLLIRRGVDSYDATR